MHGHAADGAAARRARTEKRRRENHQERRRPRDFGLRLGDAQPHRRHLRAGREGDHGGGAQPLRRVPHELRPLPPRDDRPRRDGRNPRHHPPVRHRPAPLVRGLQGHADLRAQDRRDHPDAPTRAEGHRGARLHHRLRDGSAGGGGVMPS